jgi:hypothetical protein
VIWQYCLSVDSAVPVNWQNCLFVKECASDLAELSFCEQLWRVEEHASDLAELSLCGECCACYFCRIACMWRVEEHASDLAELPAPVIWRNCLYIMDSAVPVILQNCLYVEECASDLAELSVCGHCCASDLAELPV